MKIHGQTYTPYMEDFIMKNSFVKIILRTTAVIFVTACIWIVTDKMFPEADSKDSVTVNLEIFPAGTVAENKSGDSMPTAVRNFEINIRQSENAEILKHFDVQGKGEYSNMYGYVQIWKSDQSLAHYLKISKEYMSSNVFGFREEEIKIDNITWKKWDYIVKGISVLQGFREQNGEITLCSLCVSYQERTYAFDKIFLELLQSVAAQS